MKGRDNGPRSDGGFTLMEMMVACGIFALAMGIVCGTLINTEQLTSGNLTSQQLSDAGMVVMNQLAVELRDVSNSYDNAVQALDTGGSDIITMAPTAIEFLSDNNIVSNDTAGIVGSGGGSFGTGCANEIDIALSGGNLVQTDTPPTLVSGECTWPDAPVPTTTLLSNVEPLCNGSPCAATATGATIFTYFQAYPNQSTTATSPSQVGELTIGFAVLPNKSRSETGPVVLTETVRLAAVLADPSS